MDRFMPCNTNEKTEYISRFEQTKRNKRKKQPFRATSYFEAKYTVTLNKLNVKRRKENNNQIMPSTDLQQLSIIRKEEGDIDKT